MLEGIISLQLQKRNLIKINFNFTQKSSEAVPAREP